MYLKDETLTWLGLLLKVRGSIVPRIWGRVVTVTLISVATTLTREEFGFYQFSLTTTPFTLIGLPLGIFLGFRNTASYDRFWEGRKLWGGLVNTSRTLARQAFTFIGEGAANPTGTGLSVVPSGDPRPSVEGENQDLQDFRHELIRRTIAFVHACRIHLRRDKDYSESCAFLPANERHRFEHERNVPIAQVHRMGERLHDAWQKGWIHPLHLPFIEGSLGTLTDLQGGCERINGTPIPFSYSILIHRTVALYCFLLPFGIVEAIHWMTPFVVLFISYAFFGLDQIGNDLEEPFGRGVNDLPLDAICRTIEINLRQRLGDAPLPPPLEPVKGVLS